MTTSTPTPTDGGIDDLALYQWAEDFLDALLSSADVETIGMTRWWDRAKTALETAAAASDGWRQCAAKAAAKLQIEAPNERLSATIANLAAHLDNPDLYRRWAQLAQRDALTITAMVRERRAARAPKKSTRPKPKQPSLGGAAKVSHEATAATTGTPPPGGHPRNPDQLTEIEF